MKFEIGQKVRVREDLKAEKPYGGLCFYDGSMEPWRGKTLTISKYTTAGNYCVKENCFCWSGEMLEPATLSTGDMLNALMANPEQKYKNMRTGKVLGLVDGVLRNEGNTNNAYIITFEPNSKAYAPYGDYATGNITDRWTLVPEPPKPVPFEEIRKAHAEGKKVKVVYPNFNNKQNTVTQYFWKGSDSGDNSDLSPLGLSFYMIHNGTWFIGE